MAVSSPGGSGPRTPLPELDSVTEKTQAFCNDNTTCSNFIQWIGAWLSLQAVNTVSHSFPRDTEPLSLSLSLLFFQGEHSTSSLVCTQSAILWPKMSYVYSVWLWQPVVFRRSFTRNKNIIIEVRFIKPSWKPDQSGGVGGEEGRTQKNTLEFLSNRFQL